MDLLEVGWEEMGRTDLAQDRERCRALVNAKMRGIA
jgi:hypothetical protein